MMKDNILIAKFMRWKIHEGFSYITPHYQDYMSVGAGICQTPVHRFEDLKFDSEWNWLMPVIIKIFQADEEVMYRNLDEYRAIEDSLLIPDLVKAYKAVINFIKWHNESKG